jgi:hypothetical protein
MLFVASPTHAFAYVGKLSKKVCHSQGVSLACVQVHVYLPGKNHPAHDTVRAIVKDDTDTFADDSSRVWVDSGVSQLTGNPMYVKGPAPVLVLARSETKPDSMLPESLTAPAIRKMAKCDCPCLGNQAHKTATVGQVMLSGPLRGSED